MKFDGLMLIESDTHKICRSSDYNFIFNKKNGFFARWGTKKENDPLYGPSPEIADIEITTICDGTGGKLCKFCYKSNTPNGKNMSFETFKKIFHNLPKTLGQIAFGADSHATSNPELFDMMHYCRNNDYNYVVPNITVAEISEETADKLAEVCGAVAVSRYENKNICYDSVKMLTDRGMPQINIHFMISLETFEQAMETLNDILTDPRLEKMGAIVFLSLKKKGRGKNFTPLSQDKFKQLVDFSLENNISIGFDSCSAYKFLQSVKDSDNFEQFKMCSEPCESSAFSIYCNSDGTFFPCSFAEGHQEWKEGLDLANCDNFYKDIWYHPKTIAFRESLLNTSKNNLLHCRECPLFKI